MSALAVLVAVATGSAIPVLAQRSLPRPERTLALWPDRPLPEDPSRYLTFDGVVTKITRVDAPAIEIFPAEDTGRPNPAVLVCPGGAYRFLAYDVEGSEPARWLNGLGITAIVLRYQVPGRRGFKDAQRAMGLIRQHAAEWNVDPSRVGIMGFSAGGHVAARVSTNFAQRAYPPVDDADALSARPDFAILVYPAYLSKRGDRTRLADGFPIDSETPPSFVMVSADDGFKKGALAYSDAMKKARRPVEMHLYSDGGHGYGLRLPPNYDANRWPRDCEAWLRKILKWRARYDSNVRPSAPQAD